MATHPRSKEAANRGNAKYRAKHYYQVVVTFPIEDKEKIKSYADKKGIPLTTLIRHLLYEDMER